MAYAAVRGGREAVAESIRLLEKYRAAGQTNLETETLEKGMPLLIDRIMGEAGFYAPAYAALALKQSAGSPEEAVFLLRAYRSTLSRSYVGIPMDGADLRIHRRISAAFKDIPGGQFLGATYDYTHRLLDFSLSDENCGAESDETSPGQIPPGQVRSGQAAREVPAEQETVPGKPVAGGAPFIRAGRVSEELWREGLITGASGKRVWDPGSPDLRDPDPWDITEHPLTFPAPRSARLQTLARADTGYISGLAYAAIRGFGSGHPTVGELRAGTMELTISHPLAAGEKLFVGDIVITEVESFFSEEEKETKTEKDPLKLLSSGQGDKADTSVNSLSLGMGYGIVFGRNDTKAIAMSILDYSLETADSAENTTGKTSDGENTSVLGNQEFVLLHGDSLEMNGFISHLKLPHYVTFQSKLDRVRHTRKGADHDRL